MTWLFIRFYVGVLIVLFLAWYIYGSVLKRRAQADTERVIVAAHAGGARLVAQELDATSPLDRQQVIQELQAKFDYPVVVTPLHKLPKATQRQIRGRRDVAYCSLENKHSVVVALSTGSEVVRLGPFPDYDLYEIETSLAGWTRLTVEKLNSNSPQRRLATLKQLQSEFDFPIDIAGRQELPAWPRGRIDGGEDIVFYRHANDRWFAAAPLSDRTKFVRFGPFPSFEQIEQKAATTTLALVLLPAALAIAVLLRPVARQLRHVEHAALAIAGGDLSARVEERRVRSAKPLAQAFNNMASRTEAFVRAQRELLQAVSHELRTPLSRMRFAIDLIETAKDEQQRAQRLASLDAAAEELDELVGELLSYVRMETTEPQLHREPVALRESLDVLIPKHAALHPDLRFEVSDQCGPGGSIVVAERTAFQRAIGNLLSNAARFAKQQVVVSAASHEEFVTVDIDDDGIGIPVSERQRVFQPFVRLDEGSNGRGAGLGLALVKRIVTRHGGSVEVLTSPLGGCRVRTQWPTSDTALHQELETSPQAIRSMSRNIKNAGRQ
jgi:two-component system sensor histidine kinase RstB